MKRPLAVHLEVGGGGAVFHKTFRVGSSFQKIKKRTALIEKRNQYR